MSLEACRNDVKELIEGQSARSFRTDDDWARAEDTVRRWFASVKVAESDDTFGAAFLDSRMTMRAILEDRQTGYYTNKVPIRGQESLGGVREIKTMQGVAGIKERMTASNFRGVGKIDRAKYEKGLFDVSAVLINPKLSLRIGGGAATAAPQPPRTTSEGAPPPPPPMSDDKNQIYRTTGDTTYVFMPVPREGDMYVCYMLNQLAKGSDSQRFRQFVTYMKSRFTRIILTFDGDAGAKFLDFAPAGELHPKFRYGFGNLLPATATTEEIRRRKASATRYTQVLRSRKRNEIIVAYRQHGELARQPSTFPLFAKGVFAPNPNPADANKPIHKGYAVVDEGMRPTGHVITLAGKLEAGTAEALGGRLDAYPRS